MLGSSLVVVLAILLADAAVAAGPSKRYLAHSTHEQRTTLPSGWAKRSLVSGAPAFDKRAMTLPVRINLRQNNLDRAEDLIMGVSSPESKTYGQHYTSQEVAEMFAPRRESVDSVLEWLADAGFASSRIKYHKGMGVSRFLFHDGGLGVLIYRLHSLSLSI